MSADLPAYHRIATALRGRIAAGTYPVGGRMPPARVLQRTFSVSDITIRRALGLLAQDGLVRSRRGCGTVVVGRPIERGVDVRVTASFGEWLASAAGDGQPVEQRFLDGDVLRVPIGVARSLDLPTGARARRLRRLRLLGAEPLSLHVNFVRAEHLVDASAATFAGGRTFVDLLRDAPALRASRMEQSVRAIAADPESATLLAVEPGTPLLFVETLYRRVDGSVAAVTHLHLRGDRHRYRVAADITSAPAGAR